METSIIVLLLFSIAVAATAYYFGFVKPEPIFAWLSRAGFVFMTFFMVPSIAVVLWLQSTAIDRLSKTGIIPHPSIVESVGIAVGWGKNPTWVFKLDSSLESIYDFYHSEENRSDWTIVSDSPWVLILKRGNEEMVIAGYEDWSSRTITYMLTEQ